MGEGFLQQDKTSGTDKDNIKPIHDKIDRYEKLFNYSGDDRVEQWRVFLLEKLKNDKKNIQHDTGFVELNSYIEGIETGEVIVLSGVTGNGKTLFAKSLMKNMARPETPCLVFSFEVSTFQFLKPFEDDGIHGAFMFVPMEMKAGIFNWLEERVIEAKLKYEIKIVLIDHLHYVTDMNTDKMAQNIGAAMRRLKRMAVDYNVAVILIAHQEKIKDDKEPGIETLRDSSFVGQEADTVIIVHRMPDDTKQKGADRTYDQGFALVKIDKARRSGVFRKRLTFKKTGNWLLPI